MEILVTNENNALTLEEKHAVRTAYTLQTDGNYRADGGWKAEKECLTCPDSLDDSSWNFIKVWRVQRATFYYAWNACMIYLFPLLTHNTPHAGMWGTQLYGKPLKMQRGIGKGEDRIKGDAEIAMEMQSFAVGQI